MTEIRANQRSGRSNSDIVAHMRLPWTMALASSYWILEESREERWNRLAFSSFGISRALATFHRSSPVSAGMASSCRNTRMGVVAG